MCEWWPSKRVPMGGIFHPAKVQHYSSETHQFLKELMTESKLTMQQRNKINYNLRNGEPLPNLNRRTQSAQKYSPNSCPEVVLCNRPSRLRSKNTILRSGAYEREKFTRVDPLPNRDEAKEKLQECMEHGRKVLEKKILKSGSTNCLTKKVQEAEKKPETRYDQLKEDIEERLQWLEDMERLGSAKPYRDIIRQQVAVKINEMRQLKPDA